MSRNYSRIRRTLRILALTFLAATIGNATAKAEWQETVSEVGNFSVLMPGAGKCSTVDQPTPFGMSRLHSCTYKLTSPDKEFVTTVGLVSAHEPAKFHSKYTEKERIKVIRKMFVAFRKSKFPDFTHSLQIEPGEILGRQAQRVQSAYRRGDDWSVSHSAMVYIDDIRYHIEVVQHGKGSGALLSEDEIEKIFSSFKLLSDPGTNAAENNIQDGVTEVSRNDTEIATSSQPKITDTRPSPQQDKTEINDTVIVNCTGQWRSDRMWFTLKQSASGKVAGRFGRPNQAQVGEVSGHVEEDKLLLKFRTPGGNGDIEWQLTGDSKATVRWRKSSSTRSGWDGQYRAVRHGSVPPQPSKTNPIRMVAQTQQSPTHDTRREPSQANVRQRRRGRAPRSEYGSNETLTRQVAKINTSENRSSVDTTLDHRKNTKPVEKVQAPKFASMNLLHTLPDYYGIQGSWQLVTQEKDNQIWKSNSKQLMKMDGWTMNIQSPNRADSTWVFSLDTASTPHRFDLFATEEVDPAYKGIYALDGDRLTICLAKRGADRPDNLSTMDANGTTLRVFKRAQSNTSATPESASTRILDQIVAFYGGSAGQIDLPRAAQLIRELADTGDPLGRMWLARSLFKGRCGFTEDSAEAQEIAGEVIGTVEQLAKQGNVHAIFLWASALTDGLGTDQDDAQAEQWYRVAAKKGHSFAAFNLAVICNLSDRNAQLVQWMSRAAEAGDSDAMNNLGAYNHNGENGFTVNHEKARWWYERAADTGLELAQDNLATLNRPRRNRVTIQPYPSRGGNYFGHVAPQGPYSGPGWNEDQRYEEYQQRKAQTEHWQRFNQHVAPGMQFIPRRSLGWGP